MKLTGKKKIIVIVGVAAALGVIAYLMFFRSKPATLPAGMGGDASGTGGGVNLPKEDWEIEDEYILQKYRNHPDIKAVLGWVDPLWQDRYNSPVNLLSEHEKLNGNRLLSGTFYQTLANVAPNVNGKFSAVHWDKSKPSLFPQSLFDSYWQEIAALKSKFFKLK